MMIERAAHILVVSSLEETAERVRDARAMGLESELEGEGGEGGENVKRDVEGAEEVSGAGGGARQGVKGAGERGAGGRGGGVRRVGHLLDALGEVVVSEVDAVVVRLDEGEEGWARDVKTLSASVSALRKLVPAARLVAIASGKAGRDGGLSDADAAAEADFDFCLVEPIRSASLAWALGCEAEDLMAIEEEGDRNGEAFDGEVLAGEVYMDDLSMVAEDAAMAADAELATERAAEKRETQAARQEVSRELAAMRGDVSDGGRGGVEKIERDGGRDGRQAGEEEGGSADGFGDVDLIDRLMRSPGSMAAMSIEMIESQTQMRGVGLVLVPDVESEAAGLEPLETPEGHVRVEVVYDGRPLGVLHGPAPVTAEELGPWGGWVARWLALDRRMQALWDMAQKDPLTGVWNRRYFMRFLDLILQRATTERFQVTLMIFDIDNFKVYNDKYGHPAGDEILSEAASLLRSVVRDHDVVARIGGDEFAVIFWDAQGRRQADSAHPTDVRDAAQRFRRAICDHRFPKLSDEAPGTLTISGGLASFPWDGRTPQALIDQADKMALQSKHQGKDALMFGPGALRACEIETEAEGGTNSDA